MALGRGRRVVAGSSTATAVSVNGRAAAPPRGRGEMKPFYSCNGSVEILERHVRAALILIGTEIKACCTLLVRNSARIQISSSSKCCCYVRGQISVKLFDVHSSLSQIGSDKGREIVWR